MPHKHIVVVRLAASLMQCLLLGHLRSFGMWAKALISHHAVHPHQLGRLQHIKPPIGVWRSKWFEGASGGSPDHVGQPQLGVQPAVLIAGMADHILQNNDDHAGHLHATHHCTGVLLHQGGISVSAKMSEVAGLYSSTYLWLRRCLSLPVQ